MTITNGDEPVVATLSYRDHVVLDNPVSYWRLNEALGDEATDEMRNFPGEYHGDFTRRVESFPGSGSFATEFDGASGFVEVPFTPSLNPTQPFSIEAWIRPGDLTGWRSILCSSTGGNANGYVLQKNAARLNFVAGPGVQATDNNVLTDDHWYHVVAILAGTTLTLFVDGEQVATATQPAFAVNPSAPLFIARESGGGQFWDGALADVAFYDYELSEDQITEHFELGSTEIEPEPVEPPITPPPPPPEPDRPPIRQQRQGRLVLGNLEIPLDDHAQGWACQELDLGYPTVREVMNNRPDQNGVDDQTYFFGARVVTANVMAWHDLMTADDIAQRFAPFLVVSARPTLYYSIQSGQENERSIKLRPSDFTSPMNYPVTLRSIQMAWIAPDPISYAADESMTVAFAGNAIRNGRQYIDTPPHNWEPNSSDNWASHGGPAGRYFDELPLAERPQPFPDGTWVFEYPDYGQGQTVGLIDNRGDIPVRPVLTIVGGITGPIVISGHYLDSNTNQVFEWKIVLKSTLHIDPSTAIVIDTAARTVMEAAGCRSLMTYLDWRETTWPAISARSESTLVITGTSADDGARVEAVWRSGYLT